MTSAGTPGAVDEQRLDVVILSRLSVAKKKNAKALADETRRFAPPGTPIDRWNAAITASFARLSAAKAIDGRGVVVDGVAVWKRASLVPRTWTRLVGWQLPARALGFETDDEDQLERLNESKELGAAIVARRFGLWTKGKPPTLAEVGRDIAWRALGLPGKPKQVTEQVGLAFLAASAGVKLGPPTSMLREIAKQEVGASAPTLTAVRDALVRRWLCHEPLATRPLPRIVLTIDAGKHHVEPAPPPIENAPPPAKIDLATFARTVQVAANAESREILGPRKVFIIPVWHALRGQAATKGLDVDAFKRRLLEAHRAGLLVLSRADFTGSVDPSVVAASETTDLGAVYHVIARKEPV